MPVISLSSVVRELWRIVRLFLTKFGREAYTIAKEVAAEIAKSDIEKVRSMSDAERRDHVVTIVTSKLRARYGHVPGFNWVIQFAVQFAVGWLRQQIKATP
jgi:hypothetical protein